MTYGTASRCSGNRDNRARGGQGFRIWGVPIIRGTFLGVPIIRIIVFWGLYGGPGNYHLGSGFKARILGLGFKPAQGSGNLLVA